MNKVILLGRLSRDPENRVTQNNLEITRFSLACNSENVSRNGENNAEFINCVAFGNTASVINKYCTKGTAISVIGRIHNGSYVGQDGNKRYTTEVNVESFEFAGTSSRKEGQNAYTPSYQNNSQEATPSFDNYSSNNSSSNESSMDPYMSLGDEVSLSSDDLPF